MNIDQTSIMNPNLTLQTRPLQTFFTFSRSIPKPFGQNAGIYIFYFNLNWVPLCNILNLWNVQRLRVHEIFSSEYDNHCKIFLNSYTTQGLLKHSV